MNARTKALLLVASAIMLMLAMCLSGCATRKPVFRAIVLLPPLPPERSVARSVTTIVVPSPPKILHLTWDYPPEALPDISHFNIYSSNTLLNPQWTLFARVDAPSLQCALAPTNQQAWFINTAVNWIGEESAPNTK